MIPCARDVPASMYCARPIFLNTATNFTLSRTKRFICFTIPQWECARVKNDEYEGFQASRLSDSWANIHRSTMNFHYRTCSCAVSRLHLIGHTAIGRRKHSEQKIYEPVATYEVTELVKLLCSVLQNEKLKVIRQKTRKIDEMDMHVFRKWDILYKYHINQSKHYRFLIFAVQASKSSTRSAVSLCAYLYQPCTYFHDFTQNKFLLTASALYSGFLLYYE